MALTSGLNIERVQILIDSLKSGKYPQTYYALSKLKQGIPCFCILGVACELSGLGEYYSSIITNKRSYKLKDRKIGKWHNTLPKAVLEYYGFDRDMEAALMRMNDKQHLTFLKIADYLQSIIDNDKALTT